MKIHFLVAAMLCAFGLQAQTTYRMPLPEPIQSPNPIPRDGMLTERPYGYYNLTEKEGEFVLIIGYHYESADGFVPVEGNAIARVKAGGKYGFIAPNDYPITQCIFDEASNFNTDGYAMVKLNGKWGVLDKDAHYVVSCVYDTITDMCDGWYEVSRDDQWGYVSNKGVYASSYSEYEKKKSGN